MNALQKYCQTEFPQNKFPKTQFLFDVDLKSYSYFRTGGLADCVLQFYEKEELENITSKLHQAGISFLFLGCGSNILFPDQGIKNKIILLAPKNIYSHKDNKITFSAGTFLPKAQGICHDLKLKGFEFATGIPGSIGGAVKMNAGTKLGEISDILYDVTVFSNGKLQTMLKEDLDFDYRHSSISSKEFIVDVTFKLEQVDDKTLEQLKTQIKNYLQYRKQTQPLSQPSFGSCFKNPRNFGNDLNENKTTINQNHTAAQYIEESGLKNLTIGDAMVSEKHANFIINKGKATTQNALDLISKIKNTVSQKFGVELDPEVQIINS